MENAILFTAGGRSFAIEDAIAFAELRGRLSGERDEIAEGLACREYARESGYVLETNALQHAVEEWRYGRRLLSARETLAWLERRGLTVAGLCAHLEIRLWRERFPEERRWIVSDYPSAQSEVDGLLRAAPILSGHLDALSLDLAVHAAALLEWRGAIPMTPLSVLFADLSAAYRQFRARAITGNACLQEMAASRLSLLRVELEVVTFRNRDEAQEAVFCVAQDGEDLAAVAMRADARIRHLSCFADDVQPRLRGPCLSASPGEVFVADAADDGIPVVRLVRKCEPDLADDVVRERVEKRLLESPAAALVQRHIAWTAAREE